MLGEFRNWVHQWTRYFSPEFGSSMYLTEDEEEEGVTGMETMALAYYKEIHGGEYKFVNYEAKSFLSDSFLKAHINFIAKPITATDGASSYKRFFAELDRANSAGRVLACCILDGEITAGCHSICTDKSVDHPLGGFQYGLYKPETVEVEGGGDKTGVRKVEGADRVKRAISDVSLSEGETEIVSLRTEKKMAKDVVLELQVLEKMREMEVKIEELVKKWQEFEKQAKKLQEHEKLVREVMEKVAERETERLPLMMTMSGARD